MRVRKSREINVFSLSFLDVLSNSIGGLAFLLVMAVLMVNVIVSAPPEIVTERVPDAYDGQPYEVWLSAREGLGQYSWTFGDGDRPAGLQLDATTGRLAGSIRLGADDGSERRFEFAVRCASLAQTEDGATQLDERRVELVVHRDRPPDAEPLRIATVSPLPAAYRGRSYPLVLAAEGGQPPYAWSADMPPGLAMQPSGVVAGEPTRTGSFQIDVVVEAANGAREAKRLALEVSESYPPPPPLPPLEVLTEAVSPAVALREYRLTPAAQGGAPPYAWTQVGEAVRWLSASAEGVRFGGTPGIEHVGRTSVVWEVRDSEGRTSRSRPMELQVLAPTGEAAQPLRLRTERLPDARAGEDYGLALAAEGGVAPYRWEASLPGGLALDTRTGAIAGAPAAAGTYRVTFAVADAAQQRATAELPVRVRPAIAPLAISTRDGPVARAGIPYALALAGSGGFPPYEWTASGALPDGLALDPRSGVISGTPTQAGRWRVTLSMTDAEGELAPDLPEIGMEVLTSDAVQKLAIVTSALPTVLEGETVGLVLAAEGGRAPVEWTASGLPAGLGMDGAKLAGTPLESGDYRLEVAASDASGQRDTTVLALSVRRMTPYWLAVALALALLVALLASLLLIRALRRRRPPEIAPLRILSDGIPNARASSDYSVQLACDGGEPPYVWRVVAGELPPGLELSPEGKLSGCPFRGVLVDTTKSVPFTVEVVDRRGASVRQEL